LGDILETVVFLESGNDITTKQQIYDDAITCHKCGLEDAEIEEALELNSAEDKMLHQNECRNMREENGGSGE
jgi:hypothetical protein